jgi:hypothetical protein
MLGLFGCVSKNGVAPPNPEAKILDERKTSPLAEIAAALQPKHVEAD